MKQIRIVLFLLSLTFTVNAQTKDNTGTKKDLVLTEDDKVYGLSQMWSEAKYNFVYYDKLKIDWDSLYRATIPKVKMTKTTIAYYDELRHFAAQLHDGHTGVWYPNSYYKKEAIFAPIKTSLIQGKVFITSVLNDTLSGQGLVKGMEIIKINDLQTVDYANKFVSPYEGTSTPQGQDMMVYSTYLLNGPVDEPFKLTVKDLKGKIKEFSVSRKWVKKDIPAVQFSVTADNIGVLTINSFNSDFSKKFDTLYTRILKTKSLIIDLRENGGGDGGQGYYMLKHLTKVPFPGSSSSYRQYNVILKVWGLPANISSYFTMTPDLTAPVKDKVIYDKPIAVLIGKQTYSAAEDFTILFDYLKRGPLIGQPSGGSTGKAFYVDLPGGGTFRVCIKKDTYPDGKLFVGVGIQPTIPVPETPEHYSKGIDLVMNKAIETFQKIQ